jgi:eukaryotic-like serine/threonine-protein kinase
MRRFAVFLSLLILAGCAAQAARETSSAVPSEPAQSAERTSPASQTATPVPTVRLEGQVATYRGDAGRQGLMPGPGPTGSPAVAWKFSAGGSFGSSPVVDAGVVYALSGDGVVHALDLQTGAERWAETLESTAGASPLLVRDLVLVVDDAGTVYGLAMDDGSRTWATDLGGAVSGSPALVGSVVVAANQSGDVYALDPATGSVTWRVNVGAGVYRSVAADTNAVYLGLGEEIVALGVEDGAILWRSTVSTDGVVGTPTVADGIVYAATGLDADDAGSRGIATLDAATGDPGWRYASADQAQVYTPAVAGDRAYVVGHDRLLVALDSATGTVVWQSERPSELEALAAVVGDIVYIVGNEGPAEAIAADSGEAVWSVPIRGVPFAPAVVDGYLLVGTNIGMLYAIRGSAR